MLKHDKLAYLEQIDIKATKLRSIILNSEENFLDKVIELCESLEVENSLLSKRIKVLENKVSDYGWVVSPDRMGQ